MSRPAGPLRAVRIFSLAGLGALLLLFSGGCEESLPPYEPPDIPLAARIMVNESIEASELSTVDNGFTIRVEHTGGYLNEFTLQAPYTIESSITVSLVSAPSRNITVTIRKSFTDNLRLGYWVFLLGNIPAVDSDGNRWNWPENEEEVVLQLQGKVRIENTDHDLELNTHRAETILIYEH